jgi:tetratricopeptide (TPR) repeat protein
MIWSDHVTCSCSTSPDFAAACRRSFAKWFIPRVRREVPPPQCTYTTSGSESSAFPVRSKSPIDPKAKEPWKKMAADGRACIICLDTSPPPIQSGCACRGDSGLAHIACLVRAAASQQAPRGNGGWQQCQTCNQRYTGAMQTGLAEAWRSRVAGQAAENTERLEAEYNLANSLLHQGKAVEAEPMLRTLHEVMMRVHGAEHPNTLSVAAHLARSLSRQRKHADAERIDREVLAAEKRLLGAEHPSTLISASNLAASFSEQGKYADAERIQHEVLEVQKRVLGAEHPGTLISAGNLASSLACQGKHADAERVQHEVLEVQKRVLGAEHPDTLATANNLAMYLSRQGKHVEAEQILHAALASLQRVLGPAHPDTLQTASGLECVRARIRATPPTNAATPATARQPGAARPLPDGTRVFVQRLVAKPEHNGKRARVLSFDARTGRYAVALDDGKELSPKAECVAKAGCAAAGCASEEASSMCGRCEAVRYCSRECQRTDWKAHKPVCTARTNVSADCVVHAVLQETSLTSSNTENVHQSRSNAPLSVYDTKPGSTGAPPKDDTQILVDLHMNVTLESKKWLFVGIVALIVLVTVGIAVLLVANSRSRRATNKHFDF